MIFGVQSGDTDLVDDRFVASTTIWSEQFNVTRSTISFSFVFMIAIGIIGHYLVTVLTREMFRMPGLAQCGKTFLNFDKMKKWL